MSFNYSPTYDYPKHPQNPPEDEYVFAAYPHVIPLIPTWLFSSDAPILPLGDQNSWYYPSHGNDSDEEPLAPGSTSGNWGNKTSAGARWIRRGKIASWGPGMEDWEARLSIISSRPADRQTWRPPLARLTCRSWPGRRSTWRPRP